ncbi:hypothetical protein ACLOJK_041113 [Asimina triloba]
MAVVVEEEEAYKMNARNIAMVIAPIMTQMADPLTALMHAVSKHDEAATGGSSPFSSYASDQQIDDFDSEEAEDMSYESKEPTSDDDQVNYSHNIEDNDRASLNDIEECFLRQLDEGTEDVGIDANNSSGENPAGTCIWSPQAILKVWVEVHKLPLLMRPEYLAAMDAVCMRTG